MSVSTTKDSLLAPATSTIFMATLVAGTLDILSALILYGYVFAHISAQHILQGIASALLGKRAFEGGMGTDLLGLCIHYCIAFTFVSFYFFIFPHLPFLNRNRVLSGLLYGLFVWTVMNVGVLPLIGYSKFIFHWIPSIRAALILMFAIGIPTSFIVSRYYSRVRAV
ncbi:MAG TPA: hypothetical protein VL832_15235 [Puia sp.]|nr:hypothetical protein [Puia sp.]